MGAPSFSDLLHVFGRIGLLSFGGPAAQISLMHKELVEDRPWLSEQEFLSALSFCILLPGPEAMQLATYSGWKLRGVAGGLLAGLLFVLPGALVSFALAFAYAAWGNLPSIRGMLDGIKAVLVVIVLQALYKLSSRTLKNNLNRIIAGLSIAAIFALALPFPVVILLPAITGFVSGRTESDHHLELPDLKGAIKTASLWLLIWAAPLPLLWISGHVLWISGHEILLKIAGFFSLLAVVTFGGAYAVLAYMTQEVVLHFGWLNTPQMIDALGLAETTPGPLILVTQFVGILAGYSESGPWVALVAGLTTLWVTFVPCFLWIFVGAPYVQWLSQNARLSGALQAISAAVVGVILNLSIWFSFHVFFCETRVLWPDSLALSVPQLATIDFVALGIAAISIVLLFRIKLSLLQALPCAAILGLFASLL
jgi:chromate transporter